MGKNRIADKRNLIYWFLDSQRLAAPGAEMILRRLLSSDDLLGRVRLVPDLSSSGNLLLIAARGTDTHPFLLRLNREEIFDVERALEALETEDWDDLKVYLSLNRAFFCQYCAAELQEEEPEKKARHQELTQEMLMLMIDQALDHRDQKAFDVLTERLRKLEKSEKN